MFLAAVLVVEDLHELVDSQLVDDVLHEGGRAGENQFSVVRFAELAGLDDRPKRRRVDELDQAHVQDHEPKVALENVFDLLLKARAMERVELAFQRQDGEVVGQGGVDIHVLGGDKAAILAVRNDR